MKIDSISSKAQAKHIQDVIKRHLQAAAQEMGMTLLPTKGKYDISKFEIKAEFQAQGSKALEKISGELGFQAAMLGLPADVIGKVVSLSGRQMKIIGIRARATKRPIEIEEISTGKKFVTTEDDIKRALGG
jgi:hypothetical protein